jgi:hypothetical protein
MEERDLTEFDKNVMELFDVCKEILKISEKRNLSLTDRKNPYLTRLEKYIKTYSKTDPVEHIVYFEKIYTGNKRFILLGPQRDSWLNDGNIIISFGEDCGLKTDMKLHLTGIYTTATKFRDEIREESEGLPDSPDTFETSLPSKYMLNLYRIFHEIASSENEKAKLVTHISTLETQIGISKSKEDDSLSGLFDMAANMAEQVSGSKMPRDKMPGKNDFSKMISSVIDNPKTKSMLGSMMQKFQNTNNIGEIVTELVGGLGANAGDLSGIFSGDASSTPTPSSATSSSTASTTIQAIEGDVNDEFKDFE